jgi:hypothetical protein
MRTSFDPQPDLQSGVRRVRPLMVDDLEALYGAAKECDTPADHPAKDHRLTHRAGSVTICRPVFADPARCDPGLTLTGKGSAQHRHGLKYRSEGNACRPTTAIGLSKVPSPLVSRRATDLGF